ncbi:MAG: hypothetical protein QOH89_1473 [Pseudonocardiales bacterium]|nr:hypothetical protein [Pseudonocardiales bacterium]
MTTLASNQWTVALRRAAVRAAMAPSVHNTQPWRMHIKDGRLDIFADRSRRLPVLDPTSRQLLISCGCAVMNARVSLAADGRHTEVVRSHDPINEELLASITLQAGPADLALAALDPAVETRQTNRRQFSPEEVPAAVLEVLEAAAEAEHATLFVVRDPDQRDVVAALSQRADDIENLNPAYRAELRAWTSDEPGRRDGVPPLAVPRVDGTAEDDVPIRDFDTRGKGALPAATHSTRKQTLAVVCTAGDSPAEWLRAGEALERVLLEIARHGYAASPLTQVTEVPAARAQLRQELSMMGYPHVLLRIGRAPVTASSRRRRLVDLLIDET